MDMLERATSALQKAWDEGGVDGSMLPPFTFTDAEAKYLVCSVLTAIREPKGQMIAAGARLSRMSTKKGREHDVLRNLNAMTIYTAMIDAILRDQ